MSRAKRYTVRYPSGSYSGPFESWGSAENAARVYIRGMVRPGYVRIVDASGFVCASWRVVVGFPPEVVTGEQGVRLTHCRPADDMGGSGDPVTEAFARFGIAHVRIK